MATGKYKDPLDRSVVCSDISLWAVWPPENIKTPLIEVFYVVIEVLYVAYMGVGHGQRRGPSLAAGPRGGPLGGVYVVKSNPTGGGLIFHMI